MRPELCSVAETIKSYRGKDLEDFVPHRGRNMLMDEVSLYVKDGENCGEGTVTVSRGDELGRDIFLVTHPDVGDCIHPVFLIENAALIGIIASRNPPNSMSFFSSVRTCQVSSLIRAGETVLAEVSPIATKKPFRRFHCLVTGEDGREIMSTELMAFVQENGTDERPSVDPGCVHDPIARDLDQIAERFPGRDPVMVFVDACTELDLEAQTAQFSYTYPADHPLTHGHFPDRPLMMGMTQLLGLMDGAQWLVSELRKSGRIKPGDSFELKGRTTRGDGSAVCEIKNSTLRACKGDDYTVEFQKARGVSFRGMVIPPETLTTTVEVITG